MAIAIPKVTQYITKSRKDSLVTTSKDFINAVRNDATSEMFDFPIGVDDVTIISLDLIKLEKVVKNLHLMELGYQNIVM